MIYLGKGGIPSIGSRDIVGTRICHADTKTDANTKGISTETNRSESDTEKDMIPSGSTLQ